MEEKMSTFKNFLRNDEGVTAIEYGLIAALLAVAVILVLTTLGGNLKTMFQNVANKIPTIIS